MLVRSPLTAGILMTGHTGWATRNSLLGLVVFLILIYPLAHLWQAEGLAAALLIAHTPATLVLVANSWRPCLPQIDGRALWQGRGALCGALIGLESSGTPALPADLRGALLDPVLLPR